MNRNFFHVATLASAGTGKTYSLVENYLAALFGLDESCQKKRPHQILALTFTQKAANEMRVRVAKRLSEFLSEPCLDDPMVKLASEKGKALPNVDEIKIILRSLPNAQIATFHAFCSSILRQEAATLGLLGTFDILQPNEELELAKNILRPMLIAHIKSGDQTIRNLVARFRLGAGMRASGLIEGIIGFYFKLFENGVCFPGSDLNAGKGVIDREIIEESLISIKDAIEEFSASKVSDTTRERLLVIDASFKNIKAQVAQFLEEDLALAYLALRDSVKGNFGNAELRRHLVAQVLKLGALLVDHFVAEDERAIAQLIGHFHQEFSQVKMAMMKFSYSDLLVKVKEALTDNLEFRSKIKQRYLHIMVDEYQDTSPLQEEIIALLAENKNTQQNIHNLSDILLDLDFRDGASLFVVGDKKQSIYGFRGADTRLFDRMIKKMHTSHQDSDFFSKRILKTNYRSATKIIELANLVSFHSLKAQGYSIDDDLLPQKTDGRGHAELWVSEDDENMPATKANLFCAAHGVARLLEKRSDLVASDITILVRRIKSAAIIKSELNSLGIQARIVGGEGFFQQQEIVDLLSALKLMIDPSHQLATLVVLRSPLVLLEDNDLLAVFAHDSSISLLSAKKALEAGTISEKSAKRLELFLKALEEIKLQVAEIGLTNALDILVEKLDFAYALGLAHNSEQKLANVNKLKYLLAGSKENFVKKIDDFYRRIDTNFSEPLAAGILPDEVVSIMTIHQSKGLEFKVMVLADSESAQPNASDDFLYDKELGFTVKARLRAIADCAPMALEREMAITRFDRIKQKNTAREQEEMARLLYVALTRAQQEIYVASSQAGFDAQKRGTMLSLFLEATRQSGLKQSSIAFVKAEQKAKPESLSHREMMVFQRQNGAVRIFSSALLAPPRLDFSSIIDAKMRSKFRNIDGNLAHGILAEVGANLLRLGPVDEETIKLLADASFRGAGTYEDQEKAQKTLAAAVCSLGMLKTILSEARRVIFEMPLFSWPTPSIMIEGFCDLVVEFDDFIGVIEFKSSYRLATHPDSYLQVFAYARALKEFSKPVKFAVMLVGAKTPLKWQDFDERCEKLLIDSLRAMNARA
jgi:ATP-dependent helicase/nuclease subunit A